MSWKLLLQIIILRFILWMNSDQLIKHYFQQKAAGRIVEHHRSMNMTPEQAGVVAFLSERK